MKIQHVTFNSEPIGAISEPGGMKPHFFRSNSGPITGEVRLSTPKIRPGGTRIQPVIAKVRPVARDVALVAQKIVLSWRVGRAILVVIRTNATLYFIDFTKLARFQIAG